jgi:hypothetical protein
VEGRLEEHLVGVFPEAASFAQDAEHVAAEVGPVGLEGRWRKRTRLSTAGSPRPGARSGGR